MRSIWIIEIFNQERESFNNLKNNNTKFRKNNDVEEMENLAFIIEQQNFTSYHEFISYVKKNCGSKACEVARRNRNYFERYIQDSLDEE